MFGPGWTRVALTGYQFSDDLRAFGGSDVHGGGDERDNDILVVVAAHRDLAARVDRQFGDAELPVLELNLAVGSRLHTRSSSNGPVGEGNAERRSAYCPRRSCQTDRGVG